RLPMQQRQRRIATRPLLAIKEGVEAIRPHPRSSFQFRSKSASGQVKHVACRLDFATALVAESASASPPSVGGECALGTDILEDRQEDFECLAAAVPRFASMLHTPEGDPDAPNIPTPRSYAEAITGPYSSQWQASMDAEMASWKSTGTYVDEVPPPRANIVDGMWIFRVKRPPGSPPAFKAPYVARGFSPRQGVDYFQTFSPTPKMTTLRVLLHVTAQRDYELHSLDFSTAFLQGSLHEEIWTTLAALGFAPATADPSLFLRTDTSLPPFYVLVYVDDLVFATADTEALTLVKSELQKRHTCTDLGACVSTLGARVASGPNTPPAEASLSFTLDSGASQYFFRDHTTFTPLLASVPVALGDLSSGPAVARSSTTLPCPMVPSGVLRGLHIPSFTRNLVGVGYLQDRGITVTFVGGGRTAVCTDAATGAVLATFTMESHSGLYVLHTKRSPVTSSAQVAASPQVSMSIPVAVSGQVVVSGQVAATCSCRSLAHPTVLWHHRLGHLSLPRLRSMASHSLVSSLPRVFLSLPPFLAPPCTPRIAGCLRATPHSSSLRLATAPFQTLHLDVWGPAPTMGPERERYFLVVVDDYSRYTTVFSLAKKSEVAKPRIGLVMDIARTSMIHAPHFLWPYALRYAAHQLNLQPRVLRLEVSPTSLWTGSPGVGSAFHVATPSPHSSSQSLQQPSALPRQVTVDSVGFGAGGAATGGTRSGGARSRGARAGGAGAGGASSRGAGAGGSGTGGASSGGIGAGGAGTRGASFGGAGARGTGTGGASYGGAGAGGVGTKETGAGGSPIASPTARPHRHDTRFQALRRLERKEQERVEQERQELQRLDQQHRCPSRARPSSPLADLRTVLFGSPPRRSPPVSVLPSPPESSLTISAHPITEYYRVARPVVSRVLACLVTEPHASPSSISALTTTVVEFSSTCRLDNTTRVVAAPPPRPLSVGGKSALGCDVLEDRHFELEFLAAASPSLCAMLLFLEGDPDALDISTPRSY
ncbi:unnamed protein product, partial [Closterium sp. NIES-54]